MAKVTYVQFDGTRHTVDVKEGLSIMQGAIEHGIDGIVAECGGACACGTCHVYVDPAWSERAGSPEALERETLTFAAAEMRPTSRLSCQITVSSELDGCVVYLPERQV